MDEGQRMMNNYHYRQRMVPPANPAGQDAGANYPVEQAAQEPLPVINPWEDQGEALAEQE